MKIVLPIRVSVGKKNHALNLNTYRNIHFAVNNKMKREYKSIVQEQIIKQGVSVKPYLNPVLIEYTLYVGTKRKLDISNVLCVVDKYFCDAIVDIGLLEDDNYEFVTEVSYSYGGYDKGYERVEIEVKEIK